MATTIRQVIHSTLKDDAALVALLPDGADGVLLSGRAKPETPSPFITVASLGEFGDERQDPHFDEIFMVRAYYRPLAAGATTYVDIDAILRQVKVVLHNATMTAVDAGVKVFQLTWDYYSTQDGYDDALRANWKGTRFRTHAVRTE